MTGTKTGAMPDGAAPTRRPDHGPANDDGPPSTVAQTPDEGPDDQGAGDGPLPEPPKQKPGEVGGPQGPEPTRFGDWEVGGRCTDF